MKVLVIVDLEKDFCPGGSLAVPEGDEIVPVVNKLMGSRIYDRVIASKDWHPEGHVSFASSHEGKNVFDTIEVNGKEQTLWPDHCKQNSDGARFHPKLNIELIDLIVYKGTSRDVDSYSTFFDNDGKRETELRAYLEDLAESEGVSKDEIELTFVGLATDYCVGFSAKDALRLGYKVEVIVDACRAVNLNPGGDGQPSDELKTLRELAALGASIRASREVFEEISRPRQVAREIAAGIAV